MSSISSTITNKNNRGEKNIDIDRINISTELKIPVYQNNTELAAVTGNIGDIAYSRSTNSIYYWRPVDGWVELSPSEPVVGWLLSGNLLESEGIIGSLNAQRVSLRYDNSEYIRLENNEVFLPNGRTLKVNNIKNSTGSALAVNTVQFVSTDSGNGGFIRIIGSTGDPLGNPGVLIRRGTPGATMADIEYYDGTDYWNIVHPTASQLSGQIPYSKLTLTNSIVNADISSSAAIGYSKLNLTGTIINSDISSSAAIAYSKLSLGSSIVNADISSSAAIAYSKLSLGNSIINSDISPSAAIGYSKLALTNSIVNADISSSAAIAYSKLALTNSISNADIFSSANISYSKLNLAAGVVNNDISPSAAIADTKLATISTSGKVTNSATTATSANTASAIIARDANGDFIARTPTFSSLIVTNGTSGSGTELASFYQASQSSAESFISIGKNASGNAAYIAWNNTGYMTIGQRGTAQSLLNLKYISGTTPVTGAYGSFNSDPSGSVAPTWTPTSGYYLKGQIRIDTNGYSGMDIPQITTTQRDDVNFSKRAGTVAWNSTTGSLQGYTGSAWVNIPGSSGTTAISSIVQGAATSTIKMSTLRMQLVMSSGSATYTVLDFKNITQGSQDITYVSFELNLTSAYTTIFGSFCSVTNTDNRDYIYQSKIYGLTTSSLSIDMHTGSGVRQTLAGLANGTYIFSTLIWGE